VAEKTEAEIGGQSVIIGSIATTTKPPAAS
jgi:hypothetical protein